MRNLTILALVLASVSACRDSSGDDTVTPDGPGTSDDTRIQDIQNDAMPNGTEVKVKGVVVTAVDNYGGKKGDFWAEEPGGGEYSGIHVYGAPLDQVAALHVGDVVDITGAVKDDFHYNGNNGSGGFEDGYAITELKPVDGGTMSVTATGETMTITPDVVDALAIGQLGDYHARDAEWEKWEGVLVKVTNVRATSDDDCVGSQCPDDTNHSFDITGGVLVESALGPMPTTVVKSGDCLGSVTGVVDYFFDYQILPRDVDGDGTTEDLVTQGGTCPTENQSATCGDDIDNDADGSTDCDDFDCVLGVASCRTATTINAIQTATTPPTGGVELTDVIVAGVSKNKKNIWVQSGATAAANEGLYVFGPGNNLDGFAVGSKVNIIGTVSEFNDMTGTGTLTELKALSVTAGTAGTVTVVPVTTQSVSTLNTDNGGEPYEGVLVTLTKVQVKTVGTTQGTGNTFGVGDADQFPGPTTFKTDDDLILLTGSGTCYSTITGFWTYLPFNDAWGFLPKQTTASTPAVMGTVDGTGAACQ